MPLIKREVQLSLSNLSLAACEDSHTKPKCYTRRCNCSGKPANQGMDPIPFAVNRWRERDDINLMLGILSHGVICRVSNIVRVGAILGRSVHVVQMMPSVLAQNGHCCSVLVCINMLRRIIAVICELSALLGYALHFSWLVIFLLFRASTVNECH